MLFRLLLLWVAGVAAGEPQPPHVQLREVPQYVDKTVTVTFVVRALSTSKEALLILHSKDDPGDQDNVSVIVLRQDLREFNETRWDDKKTAAAHFQGKRISATGKVRRKNGRYEVIVRKRIHLATASSPS